MFSNDWFYYTFSSLGIVLLFVSIIATFNLASYKRTFDDAFKALVMMSTSVALLVVIEWLRNVH